MKPPTGHLDIRDAAIGFHAYAMLGEASGLVKLGKSTEVHTRSLGVAREAGEPVRLLWHTRETDAIREATLHWLFQDRRVRGEWFNVTEEELALALSEPHRLSDVLRLNDHQRTKLIAFTQRETTTEAILRLFRLPLPLFDLVIRYHQAFRKWGIRKPLTLL